MAEPIVQAIHPAAERPIASYRERDESKSIFIVILELFFSRWLLICAIFFSATFWSYMTLAKAPDTYEATAQVLIRRGSLQAIRDIPILRQQEELGSEVDILLSIGVLNEVVNQLISKAKAQSGAVTDTSDQPLIFGLYHPSRPRAPLSLADMPTTDPAALFKLLKKGTRIQKFGESNVIEVGIISPSPRFAAEAVNTIIDVYEKFNLTVDREPGQPAFFAEEIARVDQEINALQSEQADYKMKHGVVAPEKERELVTLRRHSLQMQLDELQVNKVAVKTDLDAVADPATRLRASFLRQDQSIVKLRDGLFRKQGELVELRSRHTDDNPLVIAKLEEVRALDRNLQDEEDLAIAQQRHLYQQMLDKEAELQAKIAEVERHLMEFPRMEAQLDRFDRDIKQRTIKRLDMVEQMFKSQTLEQPDEAMNKVKVLGYAQIPPIPREARKGFKFMVAVLLSLIVSFVVAIFVDGLDHSIRKREQIEDQLNVPYLASLGTHYR